MDALTACQACGATLDVPLSLTALLPGPEDGAPEDPAPTRTLSLAGGTVTVRSPTVRDLLAAAGTAIPAARLSAAARSGPAPPRST